MLIVLAGVVGAGVLLGVQGAPAGAVETAVWKSVRQLGTASNDFGYAVAVDGTGNTYITGETSGTLPGSPDLNAGNQDAFVAKYDSSGNSLWVRQLGTSGQDTGYGVAVDGTGNAYITGVTYGTLPGNATNAGGSDAFVAKYDSSGNSLWVRQLGTAGYDRGRGVAVDGTGNAYITGETTGTLPGSLDLNAGNQDAFVAKYDSSGNSLWVRQLGTANYDEITGVAVDGTGNPYITGTAQGTLPDSPNALAGFQDAFVAKYDTSGTRLWVRQLGSAGSSAMGRGVAVDGTGNAYITGETLGTLPDSTDANAGGSDAFVAKYDSSGTRQWVRQLGTAGSDKGNGVAVDGTGNPYITGETLGTLPGSLDLNAGNQDAFVAKYDSSGARLWVGQLGTAGDDSGYGVAVDGTGNAYITGATSSVAVVDSMPVDGSGTAVIPPVANASIPGALPGSLEPNAGGFDAFVAKIGPDVATPVAPTSISGSIPTLTVGSAVSTTLTGNGTPAPTYAVTVGALPAGLTLGSVTGVISGTPTTKGAYSFTVTATNSAGSFSKAYAGTVLPRRGKK